MFAENQNMDNMLQASYKKSAAGEFKRRKNFSYNIEEEKDD